MTITEHYYFCNTNVKVMLMKFQIWSFLQPSHTFISLYLSPLLSNSDLCYVKKLIKLHLYTPGGTVMNTELPPASVMKNTCLHSNRIRATSHSQSIINQLLLYIIFVRNSSIQFKVMGMEMQMLHVAAWETFSIKLVLKERSFKTSHRMYVKHNYYGAIIPLLNLAVALHAMHCSHYVQMHDCCQDVEKTPTIWRTRIKFLLLKKTVTQTGHNFFLNPQ